MTQTELHFPWGDYHVCLKDIPSAGNLLHFAKITTVRIKQDQILVGMLIEGTATTGDQNNLPAIAARAILTILDNHQSTGTPALLEEALNSANTTIYHGNQYFNRQDRLSITLVAIDHNRMYLANAGALGVEWIQPDGRRLQITNPSPEKAPVGSSSSISIDAGFYLPGNENNPEKARSYGQKGLPVDQNESIVLGFTTGKENNQSQEYQPAVILSRKRTGETVPAEKKQQAPGKIGLSPNNVDPASIRLEKDPPSSHSDEGTEVLVVPAPCQQERKTQGEYPKEHRSIDSSARQKATHSSSAGGRTESPKTKPDRLATESADTKSTPRSRPYLKILLSILLLGMGFAGIQLLHPAASTGVARTPTGTSTMHMLPTVEISASPTFSPAAHVDSLTGTGFVTFVGQDGKSGSLYEGDSLVNGTSIYSDQSSLHISMAKNGIVSFLDIFPASSLSLFFDQQDDRVVMSEGAILINDQQGNFEISLTEDALAIFQVQNGIMLVEKKTESKWAASCLSGTCRFILPTLESWLVIPAGQQQTILPGSSFYFPSTAVQLTDLIQLDQVCSGCLAVLLPQITPDEWSVDSLGPTVQWSATSTPGKTISPTRTQIPATSYPTSTNKPPVVPTATYTPYLTNTPAPYHTNTPMPTQAPTNTPYNTPDPTQPLTATPAHSSQFSSVQITENPVEWYQVVVQWFRETLLNAN